MRKILAVALLMFIVFLAGWAQAQQQAQGIDTSRMRMQQIDPQTIRLRNVIVNGTAMWANFRLQLNLATMRMDWVFTGDFGEEEAELLPLARVKAIEYDDHQVYPDELVAITLAGGYGTHENNLIRTSGVNNVGIQEYVYFEGRENNRDGNPITSYSWALTHSPFDSTVELENANTRMPRLRPDLTGLYTVTLTAADAGGAVQTTSVDVHASTYVGIANCASCHTGNVMPDIMTGFMNTGHSTKFLVTFARYSATSDYCVRCHTLGYDETADNGGFDDAARRQGWSSANKGTLQEVLRNPDLSRLINIQCENCHGPGAIHTGAKTMDVGVCAQCHGQQEQWRQSPHANMVHQDSNSENPACVSCHTGEGYVEASKGQSLSLPLDASDITCQTCHDSHRQADLSNTTVQYSEEKQDEYRKTQLRAFGRVTLPNGTIVEAGISATCMKCHNSRRPNVEQQVQRGGFPHVATQADMFAGTGGYEYQGVRYGNSLHALDAFQIEGTNEKCATCHMFRSPVDDDRGTASTRDDVTVTNVGGHSFKMAGMWNWTRDDPDRGLVRVENVGACQQCHEGLDTFNRRAFGDYDGDGTVEGVQDEVHGLLQALFNAIQATGVTVGEAYPYVAASAWSSDPAVAIKQKGAAYNYVFVEHDGSAGIHNTRYSVQLLQSSYRNLTGRDVPNAQILR